MLDHNPYVELTTAFNEGRLRAIISSGQAVVLHRLAIMSKDGDWILKEDDEALDFVLGVLEERGARYRFGAPLDRRWLAGGWSAHLEHQSGPLRLRTDFVTRPPRLSPEDLSSVWHASETQEIPLVGLAALAKLKKTNREKDYVVIGELARQMPHIHSQLLFSRSARDLIRLARDHSSEIEQLVEERPVLRAISEGRSALEQALDAERRTLIRKNEQRLESYLDAARKWREIWPAIAKEIASRPLRQAHELIINRAERFLPKNVNLRPMESK